jgi:ferritin-like metal-binding protein YciE
MIENTDLTQPPAPGDASAIAQMRSEYIAAADPLGTVPPPATIKGTLASGLKMIQGKRPQVFIDKLGERLAFERTGTRLYQALLMKCEAPHAGPDLFSIDTLRRFCDEEAAHFAMLEECIRMLGADPTVQTPCADLAGVESMGLMQAITDARTTINQSIHAILVAELADNAAWEELIVLANEMGQPEMASRFEQALAEESTHLETIRHWHQEATLAEARIVSH